MFESVDNVVSRLADQGYICDKRIGTVVYLAQQLQKPVLVCVCGVRVCWGVCMWLSWKHRHTHQHVNVCEGACVCTCVYLCLW